ncbi:MAG TPA: hypothetical protein VFY32_12900, partial [Solirubrobacteraceae bacterium]|nr:hypothetical protein [Solirubrobacteraceae bacterium]
MSFVLAVVDRLRVDLGGGPIPQAARELDRGGADLDDGVRREVRPLCRGHDGVRGGRLVGDQWYWRADFVKEIPDEAVEIHARFGAEMPTWKSTMHMYPIDGAPAGGVAPALPSRNPGGRPRAALPGCLQRLSMTIRVLPSGSR